MVERSERDDRAPEAGKPGYTSALVEEYLNGGGGRQGHFDQLDASNDGNKLDAGIYWAEFEKYRKDHQNGSEAPLLNDIATHWKEIANWSNPVGHSYLTRQGIKEWAAQQQEKRQEQEGSARALAYLSKDGNFEAIAGRDGKISPDELDQLGRTAAQDLAKLKARGVDENNPEYKLAKEQQFVAEYLAKPDNSYQASDSSYMGSYFRSGLITKDGLKHLAEKRAEGNSLEYRAGDGTPSTPVVEADKLEAEKAKPKLKAEETARTEQAAMDTAFRGLDQKTRDKITAAVNDAADKDKQGWNALDANESAALRNALTAVYGGKPQALGQILNETYAGKTLPLAGQDAFKRILEEQGVKVDTTVEQVGTASIRSTTISSEGNGKGIQLRSVKDNDGEFTYSAPKPVDVDGSGHIRDANPSKLDEHLKAIRDAKPDAERPPEVDPIADRAAQARRQADAALGQRLATAYGALSDAERKGIDTVVAGVPEQARTQLRGALVALENDTLTSSDRLSALGKMVPNADPSVSDTTATAAFQSYAKTRGLEVFSSGMADRQEGGDPNAGFRQGSLTIRPEGGTNGIKLSYDKAADAKAKPVETYEALDKKAGVSSALRDIDAATVKQDAKQEQDRIAQEKEKLTKAGDEYVQKWLNKPEMHRYTADKYDDALRDALANGKPVVIVATKGYDSGLVDKLAHTNGEAVYVYLDTTKPLPDNSALRGYNPYPNEAQHSAISSWSVTSDGRGLCNGQYVDDVKPAPQVVPHQYAPQGYAPPYAAYAQPGYAQPGYGQPVYAQPEYAQPCPTYQPAYQQQRRGLFGRQR